MEKDKPDLAAELDALVSRSGFWLDAISDAGKQELEVVRNRFRQGLYGGKAWQVARFVIELGNRRGWRMPGPHAIVCWLRR